MTRSLHTDLAPPELFGPEAFIGAEMERMKDASGAGRGAIYTRSEVVDFILDLAGYTADKALWSIRLLEPSFGAGDFLIPAVRRLLESAKRDRKCAGELVGAVRAVELHRDTFAATQTSIHAMLVASGIPKREAATLVSTWLLNGDFLLQQFPARFDVIVGNPPYVRQELISAPLLAEYRRRFTTLYDRADLYVPFIEQSLRLLGKKGVVAFICSDRWMKNRYGGPLREMVARDYSLKFYVDMVGTAAFQSEVVAYPAITVIQRGAKQGLRMAHRPEVSSMALGLLHRQLTGPAKSFGGAVIEMPFVAKETGEPWLLEADAQPSLSLVRRLESEFPTLAEAGCSVGIGVATGADKVFIAPMDELEVEDERKLPLATTRDLAGGTVKWRGLGVVNPFEENGTLADFARYPRFAAYMTRHSRVLKARHCARKANGSWYRTIDRITPSLAAKPKLLIPDIKGDAHIVLEEEGLYPHHNLYFILSKEWPLPVLQAVLMSGVAHLFVRAYSTKMHGGALRFQAQYLRRIRLPRWADLGNEIQQIFTTAVASNDQEAIHAAVASAFRLTTQDQVLLFPNPK